MKTTILNKTVKVEKQRDFPILAKRGKYFSILIKKEENYYGLHLNDLTCYLSSRVGTDFLESWVLFAKEIKHPRIKVTSKKFYEGDEVYPCFKTDENGHILCLFVNKNDGILLSIFTTTQFSFIPNLACDNTIKSFGVLRTLDNPVIEIYGEETSFI